MQYIKPELTYKIFARENIITASDPLAQASTSAKSLRSQLKEQSSDIMTETTPTYVVMWD